MGHSSVRASVRRRKVASQAAYSRQFTVNNIKKSLGEISNVYLEVDRKTNMGKIITEEQKGKREADDKVYFIKATQLRGKLYNMAPHKGSIVGDFIKPGQVFIVTEKPDKYGLHAHIKTDAASNITKEERKQPKRLHKKMNQKKINHLIEIGKLPKDFVNRSTYKEFKNYPYVLPKMNLVEYSEKLVQHKLAKWCKKHPKPMEMFVDECTKWEKERFDAETHIRDFVVSMYDPLLLTGRFKVETYTSTEYTEEKIAELKDTNGDGHRVTELKDDSKLLKKAKKITNQVKRKRNNLVATRLSDHKRQRARIILPEAA